MLLGFVVTGFRALYRTAQNFKAGLDRFYPLCAGIFCGPVGVLVHCFFENIFEEPYMLGRREQKRSERAEWIEPGRQQEKERG